jgi:ABC-2 type transport system permease protein
MAALTRHLRLWFSLARFGLVREMAFRSNFLVKVTVEALWLAILLIFYDTVFSQTSVVAEWSRQEYLFFVGCHFALGGLIETLFLGNCGEFSDLVRSGDLDMVLLKPVDEQFLVSCRDVDWSTAPNVLMGAAVMGFALWQMDWALDPVRAGLFLVLFTCGLAVAYGFLLILTSSAVWLVRNQSLYEVWWLFTTLMRYPREIFLRTWAAPLGFVFTFVLPVMVVVNVPARVMVKALEPEVVAFTVAAAVVMLYLSRKVFRLALRRYRSASS